MNRKPLYKQATVLCESVIAKAKAGNMQAAKIILDRLLPPRKDNPVNIEFPNYYI